jgi:uncharacterized membrane protein YfhO
MVNRVVTKEESGILELMQEKGFDPERVVVFEPEHTHPDLFDNHNKEFKGSCAVLGHDYTEIKIRTAANGPGYLVLSEVFYPGWQATVDGKEVPVLCGNYLFRVVPVGAGTHEVVLRFVSWPFRVGAAISLLTLVSSVWFIVWKRREAARKA